jgi:mannose-1-phosphate guanylyltransferase
MNGDIYHDIDLRPLLTAHAAGGCAVTLALHDFPRFNTVRVRDNRVCGFGKAAAGEKLLVFTGIHVLNPEVIAQIPAQGFFHIIDLYQRLAEVGQVGFVRVDGCFWQDIGTPVDYLDLHCRLLADKTPSWAISNQAEIGAGVRFEGWGAVGAGAVIGTGTHLSRCIIWDKTIIAPGAMIVDQILCPEGIG